MKVSGIQFNKSLEPQVLTAEVNLLKKDIKVVPNDSKKSSKKIASIPTYLSTFRYFEFPFKNKDKILKAIETTLSLEIPNWQLFTYRAYIKDNKVFCVITRKDLIEKILKKVENLFLLDSDIFPLIRVAKREGFITGKIGYLYEDIGVVITIENSFPTEVLHISVDNLKELFKKGQVLEITAKNIEQNLTVAYGNILRVFDDEGINFLEDKTAIKASFVAKLILLLLLGLAFVSLGLGIKIYQYKKELKYIKDKEKEVFIKYFNSSVVIDPLSQAKGKVATLSSFATNKKDAAEIMEYIGKTLSKNRVNFKVINLQIGKDTLYLTGLSKDISNVEKLKKFIADQYKTVFIEETSKDANGMIRFKLRATNG